ncbi:replication/maintenance protein RepL [Listeria monocytogenes]|uniref:replication/maintenance protein RepL n=1 Tax=Listeria monocytogenes TaxID=1639 RepID=UPI00047DED10|nr:replication/maintenance protein RepL [Listeria monocytogenes]
MSTTRKKIKVIGTETYIKQDTGEIKEMNVINVEERDANFHKLWLGHIIQSLDLIGNKKIKVLNFIMNNLNSENYFLMTQQEMEKELGISRKTISDTMKALQESDFLTLVRSGTYRINPDVLFKGGKNNRLSVLIEYHDQKNKETDTEEQ